MSDFKHKTIHRHCLLQTQLYKLVGHSFQSQHWRVHLQHHIHLVVWVVRSWCIKQNIWRNRVWLIVWSIDLKSSRNQLWEFGVSTLIDIELWKYHCPSILRCWCSLVFIEFHSFSIVLQVFCNVRLLACLLDRSRMPAASYVWHCVFQKNTCKVYGQINHAAEFYDLQK